jgi:MoaA/NifB/PqqE/SkfB family radical SAM enzyme
VPYFEKLSVASWEREPDYSDDYERLARLEAELSDGPPVRYELLSIWRLARDARYAGWARRVGPDTCQVTFFGLEQTQDWFCRRRGSFRDCVAATERLLEAGMKPRWQLFLTKEILPDLGGLMRLVERMRLRERVAALGSEFAMFIHVPSFVGEGRKIAHLAATQDDTKQIPGELIESTQRHVGTEQLWVSEAEAVAENLQDERPLGHPEPQSDAKLWFGIAANWDVFPSFGSGEPWWRLGNLKRDGLGTILTNFEQQRVLPLRLNQAGVRRELARRYGDPSSQRLVGSAADLADYWLERRCEELHAAR